VPHTSIHTSPLNKTQPSLVKRNRAANKKQNMKRTIAALTLLAVTAAGVQTASAGDREWATAGKVLTGLFAASVVARALEPAPVYQTATYYAPPVYVTPPAQVYVQPAPVVVALPPVVVVPAPRYYYYPPPAVSFSFGFGHYHHHHHHPYRCW
jgi:hypothetical protein